MMNRMMNRTVTGIVLVVAICATMMALAIAQPPTPFAINGHVYDSDGEPCSDPLVQITNLDSSEGWDAENFSASNYYQLVLDSDDVNESEILRFDASGCSQANTTEHTVLQSEIDNGGFELNITLEPEIISCDVDGNEKNEFVPGEIVYVRGSGLAASTNYTLWIQDDPVGDGNALVASEDPSELQEQVMTNASGDLAITAIWNIPSDASPTHYEYDIVVDNQDVGNVGTYNAANDGIDSATLVGFVAPVPELPSIALFAVGLVMLIGLVRFGRRE